MLCGLCVWIALLGLLWGNGLLAEVRVNSISTVCRGADFSFAPSRARCKTELCLMFTTKHIVIENSALKDKFFIFFLKHRFAALGYGERKIKTHCRVGSYIAATDAFLGTFIERFAIKQQRRTRWINTKIYSRGPTSVSEYYVKTLFFSGDRQVEGFADHIGSFLDVKVPITGFKCVAGRLSCASSGCGSILGGDSSPSHFPQLKDVDYRYAKPHRNRYGFQQGLPPWGLIGAACAGFLLMWWGWWWSISTGRRTSWGLWGFFMGCVVLGYSFNLRLGWWLCP